ncbi:MAG: hypothetical protein K2O63_00595, partial [Alistipes sp.]|nr:hypothetical protein [Alistipes sp.]
ARYLVLLNFSSRPARIAPEVPLDGAETLLHNYPTAVPLDGSTVELRPFEGILCRIATPAPSAGGTDVRE